MEKVLYRSLIILALFFSTWFVLNQIDWITIFNVEKLTSNTEEKLGEIFWEMIEQNNDEIDEEDVITTIDSLISIICTSNNIDQSQIKVHILNSNEVNAYALPGNHLVLCKELILSSNNESELCGVICHELAHIERDHVVKKLVKEIGLSVLISTTIGNSSPDIISSSIKTLSSTAYDRNLEREADLTAVDYMINSDIDPLPFADFLSRTWGDESEIMENLSWVSTHPEANARSEYIIAYCNDYNWGSTEVLAPSTWINLKSKLEDY